MEWWMWILLGLLLLLGEIVTPGGLYIIWSAFSRGFSVAWFQVILFSVLSVIALWLFRERRLQFTQGGPLENMRSFLAGRTIESAAVADGNSLNWA